MFYRDVSFIHFDPLHDETVVHYLNSGEERISGRTEDVINRWCIRNGSTLRGRVDAVMALTSYVQKVPVPVDLRHDIFLFPLLGRGNKDNVWISYTMVSRIATQDNGNTLVTFRDGSVQEFAFDRRIFRRQMKRCARLKSLFTL